LANSFFAFFRAFFEIFARSLGFFLIIGAAFRFLRSDFDKNVSGGIIVKTGVVGKFFLFFKVEFFSLFYLI